MARFACWKKLPLAPPRRLTAARSSISTFQEHMPSTKKLTHYRRSQFAGSRRGKPPVRRLNQAIRERIDGEHDLIQTLIQDRDNRAALWCGMKDTQPDPLLVWKDFDHSYAVTELWPKELPPWQELGEYAKFHLLFQIVLTFGGYSFTARVRPDLQDKWQSEGRDALDRIKREMRKAIEINGLTELEYCYVVEGRSKWGGTRVPLHLHGFFIADDPFLATRFRLVLERAVSVHLKGKVAAGYGRKSGNPIDIQPAYDVEDKSRRGKGRWASYLAKNATKWDQRMTGKRTFMSRTATQTVREFWWLLQEDVYA